ncbi:MAG: single-stranded DNA-binding protein, partial [Anaerolineales bacterium]
SSTPRLRRSPYTKEIPMFHTIIIVGNLGKDPEMRYTPSGQAVTSFSVATSRKYTSSNGEQVNETIWFRVSAWGKQAEVCNQYLKKGSKVLVEGRLTPDKNTGGPRIWQKQDGSSGASFEVTAGTVRFLSSRGDSDSGAGSATDAGDMAVAPAEDDIPF